MHALTVHVHVCLFRVSRWGRVCGRCKCSWVRPATCTLHRETSWGRYAGLAWNWTRRTPHSRQLSTEQRLVDQNNHTHTHTPSWLYYYYRHCTYIHVCIYVCNIICNILEVYIYMYVCTCILCVFHASLRWLGGRGSLRRRVVSWPAWERSGRQSKDYRKRLSLSSTKTWSVDSLVVGRYSRDHCPGCQTRCGAVQDTERGGSGGQEGVTVRSRECQERDWG